MMRKAMRWSLLTLAALSGLAVSQLPQISTLQPVQAQTLPTGVTQADVDSGLHGFVITNSSRVMLLYTFNSMIEGNGRLKPDAVILSNRQVKDATWFGNVNFVKRTLKSAITADGDLQRTDQLPASALVTNQYQSVTVTNDDTGMAPAAANHVYYVLPQAVWAPLHAWLAQTPPKYGESDQAYIKRVEAANGVTFLPDLQTSSAPADYLSQTSYTQTGLPDAIVHWLIQAAIPSVSMPVYYQWQGKTVATTSVRAKQGTLGTKDVRASLPAGYALASGQASSIKYLLGVTPSLVVKVEKQAASATFSYVANGQVVSRQVVKGKAGDVGTFHVQAPAGYRLTRSSTQLPYRLTTDKTDDVTIMVSRITKPTSAAVEPNFKGREKAPTSVVPSPRTVTLTLVIIDNHTRRPLTTAVIQGEPGAALAVNLHAYFTPWLKRGYHILQDDTAALVRLPNHNRVVTVVMAAGSTARRRRQPERQQAEQALLGQLVLPGWRAIPPIPSLEVAVNPPLATIQRQEVILNQMRTSLQFPGLDGGGEQPHAVEGAYWKALSGKLNFGQ